MKKLFLLFAVTFCVFNVNYANNTTIPTSEWSAFSQWDFTVHATTLYGQGIHLTADVSVSTAMEDRNPFVGDEDQAKDEIYRYLSGLEINRDSRNYFLEELEYEVEGIVLGYVRDATVDVNIIVDDRSDRHPDEW